MNNLSLDDTSYDKLLQDGKNIDLKNFKKCDIFTPNHISELMASKLNNNGTLLEPSVGIGSLLKYINLDNYKLVDVYELKSIYLKKIIDKKINKFNLDFLKEKIYKKYDNIILNPPYIKIQDLTIEYRNFLKKNFSVLNKGNVDIYYAFILKCINLLEDSGIMVSITPNAYLYNKSSFGLRKFLFENKLIKEIIDFKTEKVFNGISVYCCITIFTKKDKDFLIYNNKNINYSSINKVDYNIFNTSNIEKKTLKDVCKIRNGIATLRDNIYIHIEKLYNEPCWKEITNGKKIRYIIYPYENGKIIDEKKFKKYNPNTYSFLLENKNELSKRDKGKKKYPTWYAYGRSQSLMPPKKQKVIYLSCFINPDKLSISITKSLLFQGCLCIEPNDEDYIDLIKKSICNNIDFIKSISPKRSGGWINLSSRNLYKIPLLY